MPRRAASVLRTVVYSKLTNFKLARTVPEVRQLRREAMFKKKTIGFVPTMGALHQGHLALIRQAAEENDQVYVSIYVNPTQFGINEDLGSYPRTWPADSEKLEDLNTELTGLVHKHGKLVKTRSKITTVFMPSTEEMYPSGPPSSEVDGQGSFVTITPLSTRLEGASRPVFFRGVATVCMKLLNIVQPEKVYFGQKDIQQTFVVKRMVQDFHLNTQVRVGLTVRDDDGLAMSSRNVYLGERRRKVALVLLNALKAVQQLFARGARKRRYLYRAAMDHLTLIQKQQQALPKSQRALFEIDYISLADPATMDELEEVKEEAILSGAIKMLPVEDPQSGEDCGDGGGAGVVRLIDNIQLDLLSAKVGYIR